MGLNPTQAAKLEAIDTRIQSAKRKRAIAMIAAGPLEDLLGSDEGQLYLPDVLDNARKIVNWRFALGCVWTGSFRDRSVAKQIDDVVAIYFPNGRP